jgi:hypothetical protein
MAELSHFEQASTKIPMRDPMIVIGGFLLLPLLLYVINLVSPNEAVDELKKTEQAQGEFDQPAALQSADDDEI